MTNIAIMGAGAIGSTIGGLLAEAGLNVVLIGRGPHVKAIKDKGLYIDGIKGVHRVHNLKVTTDASGVEDADMVFLTVKSQDTEAAVHAIEPYTKEGSTIISLQNGVRNVDKIEEVLKEGNVLGGVALFNATFLQPGSVTLTMRGGILIGEPDGEISERAKMVANVTGKSGIKTKAVKNIKGVLWSKLMLNLNNSIMALCDIDFKGCYADKYTRKTSMLVMKEAVNVLEASGIKLGSPSVLLSPSILTKGLRVMVKVPDSLIPDRLIKIAASIPLLEDVRVSTWQSLYKGKKSEIDYLNGEIVRLGEEVGISTPVNRTLVQMVKNAESELEYMQPNKLWECCKSLGEVV